MLGKSKGSTLAKDVLEKHFAYQKSEVVMAWEFYKRDVEELEILLELSQQDKEKKK